VRTMRTRANAGQTCDRVADQSGRVSEGQTKLRRGGTNKFESKTNARRAHRRMRSCTRYAHTRTHAREARAPQAAAEPIRLLRRGRKTEPQGAAAIYGASREQRGRSALLPAVSVVGPRVNLRAPDRT
jgi:hypothetical protein